MPTQLFVFVYWEKGYTNPIRCQRAWAAHRNSTLKGGAATERDGKGLDALATNFNLLTRLASHYPFALFVGDNHVATRGYALQFEDALLVGPTLTAGAEIIYSGLFENNQRVFGRPAGANDLPGDLHSFGALHRKISLHPPTLQKPPVPDRLALLRGSTPGRIHYRGIAEPNSPHQQTVHCYRVRMSPSPVCNIRQV